MSPLSWFILYSCRYLCRGGQGSPPSVSKTSSPSAVNLSALLGGVMFVFVALVDVVDVGVVLVVVALMHGVDVGVVLMVVALVDVVDVARLPVVFVLVALVDVVDVGVVFVLVALVNVVDVSVVFVLIALVDIVDMGGFSSHFILLLQLIYSTLRQDFPCDRGHPTS